jgi:hypothetical protein
MIGREMGQSGAKAQAVGTIGQDYQITTKESIARVSSEAHEVGGIVEFKPSTLAARGMKLTCLESCHLHGKCQ